MATGITVSVNYSINTIIKSGQMVEVMYTLTKSLAPLTKKYIDVYNEKEIYKQNLCNRVISKDDTMIIRHYKMSEYIPELLVEFYEQPELQYFILRVLLVFQADELRHFYNQIMKIKFICFSKKSEFFLNFLGVTLVSKFWLR